MYAVYVLCVRTWIRLSINSTRGSMYACMYVVCIFESVLQVYSVYPCINVAFSVLFCIHICCLWICARTNITHTGVNTDTPAGYHAVRSGIRLPWHRLLAKQSRRSGGRVEGGGRDARSAPRHGGVVVARMISTSIPELWPTLNSYESWTCMFYVCVSTRYLIHNWKS